MPTICQGGIATHSFDRGVAGSLMTNLLQKHCFVSRWKNVDNRANKQTTVQWQLLDSQ